MEGCSRVEASATNINERTRQDPHDVPALRLAPPGLQREARRCSDRVAECRNRTGQIRRAAPNPAMCGCAQSGPDRLVATTCIVSLGLGKLLLVSSEGLSQKDTCGLCRSQVVGKIV